MSHAKQILKEIVRWPIEAALNIYLSDFPRAELSPEKVRRILVFAYHGLGNFIMYTPALRQLRERYPDARIDLQVGNDTGCEEVLAGSGLFDNIYNLRYKSGARAWIERAREIRETRYDLTINEFHSHSWKLALLVAASGATWRLGHVTSPGWPFRFSRYSFVFNIPVRMREAEHEVERYMELVSAAGAPAISIDEARPFIHLEQEDREFAHAFFESHSLEKAGTVIGVQPGTSPAMRWKQWPLDRYRELISRLIDESPDSHIVLFGSESEWEMINKVAGGLGPRVTVAAGRTTVKQVAALIENCDMLVCNDSGLMHVAVAVGTPVVAIYGPTDIRRTAPLGRDHVVIRHELPCSPCFRLDGEEQIHLCPHHDCLMTITQDEVFDTVVNRATARLSVRS
ncbi:MAG TPA: lipopolysaccharide heptosyltransferase II [Blastocatellia bacterium]|jgi:heptosyltransferase-2|nr:lipopolysaccharide heptosyltransferase II [Blastocatellia bacterium]